MESEDREHSQPLEIIFREKNSFPTRTDSQNSCVSLKKERLLPLTPCLCSGFVAPLVLLSPSCWVVVALELLGWHSGCWDDTQTAVRQHISDHNCNPLSYLLLSCVKGAVQLSHSKP